MEYDALVNCVIARRLTHEVCSKDPNELIDRVRGLVRALVAGTYWEEERDEPHGVAMKAAWPGGGSGRFSLSRDPDRSLTEWRKRAYDPY